MARSASPLPEASEKQGASKLARSTGGNRKAATDRAAQTSIPTIHSDRLPSCR